MVCVVYTATVLFILYYTMVWYTIYIYSMEVWSIPILGMLYT